jgi:chemotaxis protein methyltransferase CheR
VTGPDPVDRFRGLLATRLGWTFAAADRPHLAQRLERRAAECGLDHDAYLDRLGAGGWPAEMSRIAEDLTITETYFFRHGEQFRALAAAALPERMAAREPQRVLRLLSVGCSSGEEAYTLAIVAREALAGASGGDGPQWLVSVRGLDANPAMLRRAAEGRYSAWALRETPHAARRRWFHAVGDTYEVDAELRAMVRWQQHNVADEDAALWRAGQYDVIFCRNLLMYLTPAAAQALVRRMTRALAPGGHLFLGHTDTLGSRPEGLEARHSHGAFYYRRAPAEPPPAPRAEPPAVRAAPPEPPPSPGRELLLRLVREERFAEALAASGRPGNAAAEPRDLLVHGVLLAQAGRTADAEMAARALLDVDGLYADAHHLLGVCLEDGAAVDVAIGHYRLAAYLDPAFAMPRLRMGLLARRRGDDRTAAAELDRALHLLRAEDDDRITLFGGGFGRIALAGLCRSERDACGARR